MDDIEDIIAPVKKESPNPKGVKITKRRPKDVHPTEEPVTNFPAGIPGTQRIYVKTWGCAHNNSDSEYMAGQLSEYGYIITENREEADLWLLNSCTVKGPSQEHFLTATRRAKGRGKNIVVAGCVPQGDKKLSELDGISVIGTQQIDRVVEVCEETLKGHTVRLFSQARREVEINGRKVKRKAGGARLDLPKIRKNPLVEIVPINTGCLNQCTYCKTKHARGDLGSYDPEEIVSRVSQVIKEGVKEIWLTSEDTGAYGLDIGTNIAELLDRIVEVLTGDVMLRIGMTNPPYILDHLEAVARILNHPRVYAFLHVPVQAASDSVLESMKRKYTCAEFRRVVDYLMENVAQVQIATDIICGFPTESEDDFKETLQLVDHYKFEKLHISQFYPRPGTPAARMKKLPTQVVKSRSRAVTALFESFTPFQNRLGVECKILVTEIRLQKTRPTSTEKAEYWVGHNKGYEMVTVRKREGQDFLGKTLHVKVFTTGKFHQEAALISETNSGVKRGSNSVTKSGSSAYLILFFIAVLGILIKLLFDS